MPAQEFSTPWPAVLQDMQEFVVLSHLSLGRGRAGRLLVTLSRQGVAPDQLQPHVGRFRDALAHQAPGLRLTVTAADVPTHRVDLQYTG